MIDRSYQMSIPKEELEQIFKRADIDQDGFVTLQELLMLGGPLGGPLKGILTLVGGDTDGDKRLSLEEFLKYIEQKQA